MARVICSKGLTFQLRVSALFACCCLGSLLVTRLLLTAQLERDQIEHAAQILSRTVQLSELVLEDYPPAVVSKLNGFPLVQALPASLQPGAKESAAPDRRLEQQAQQLNALLTRSIGGIHPMVPVTTPQRGIWIRLYSPVEPVWMFFSLPVPGLITSDPLVLFLALLSGGVLAVALFQFLEVQRPIRQLGRAMELVGTGGAKALPAQAGAPEVRCLVDHFNAMLDRLQTMDRDRQTMLAGMAHDLNSPLTRLRLRLTAESSLLLDGPSLLKVESDLHALERLTRQFLLFAGSGANEEFVQLPLDSLLYELSGRYEQGLLNLDCHTVEAWVQPVAIGRAVANLIDNALAHGAPPVQVELRCHDPLCFRIAVSDAGAGIPEPLLPLAMEPFRRLDPARRGEGHSGLGLAIVQKIALQHGGELRLSRSLTSSGLCASFVGQLQAPLRALVPETGG